MSYSLNSKCWDCKKGEKCVDGAIIQGAITTIHCLCNKGHLGAGSIIIDCTFYDKKEATDAPV